MNEKDFHATVIICLFMLYACTKKAGREEDFYSIVNKSYPFLKSIISNIYVKKIIIIIKSG